MPRILIVDDDEALRAWLAAVLEGADYRTDQMDGPEGVLRHLSLGGVDLALIDYHMPQGSGLQLLRELRAKNNTTPVVILTADASQQVAVECFRAGASDFVAKPVDPDYLKIIVKRVLDTQAKTLRNTAYRAMGYMQHKAGCKFFDDGKSCDCGLKEIYEDIQDF